jgi:hypothetical protein
VRRRAEEMFLCLNCGGDFRIASVTSEMPRTVISQRAASYVRAAPLLFHRPKHSPFVPSESYASSFGFQWNHFDRIQIDKFMRITR